MRSRCRILFTKPNQFSSFCLTHKSAIIFVITGGNVEEISMTPGLTANCAFDSGSRNDLNNTWIPKDHNHFTYILAYICQFVSDKMFPGRNVKLSNLLCSAHLKPCLPRCHHHENVISYGFGIYITHINNILHIRIDLLYRHCYNPPPPKKKHTKKKQTH